MGGSTARVESPPTKPVCGTAGCKEREHCLDPTVYGGGVWWGLLLLWLWLWLLLWVLLLQLGSVGVAGGGRCYWGRVRSEY